MRCKLFCNLLLIAIGSAVVAGALITYILSLNHDAQTRDLKVAAGLFCVLAVITGGFATKRMIASRAKVDESKVESAESQDSAATRNMKSETPEPQFTMVYTTTPRHLRQNYPYSAAKTAAAGQNFRRLIREAFEISPTEFNEIEVRARSNAERIDNIETACVLPDIVIVAMPDIAAYSVPDEQQ